MNADDVIRWLASTDGQAWQRATFRQPARHHYMSGTFGELIADGQNSCFAAWPEPFRGHDLERMQVDG